MVEMIYQSFYLYSVSQATNNCRLDLLCHKASQNANQEINHTDDKRDEKEDGQSCTLSTCSFQPLWLDFSPRREFICTWSALSVVLPSWWALCCEIWRIWECEIKKTPKQQGKKHLNLRKNRDQMQANNIILGLFQSGCKTSFCDCKGCRIFCGTGASLN